jgi:predicted phosphodiesterase
MSRQHVVGLVSDTHGLLRIEALDFLRGSDFIVHAGDVGHPAIRTRATN